MDIATLKTQLPPIERLVQQHIPLKHRGTFWVGRCPFHTDRGRPNLVVFPHTQTWKCFVCGAQGDSIDWITRTESRPLQELLHTSMHLRPRAAVIPMRRTPNPAATAPIASRHHAYQAWIRTLHLTPEDTAYLHQRGLRLDTIARAQFISYTPGSIPASVIPTTVARIPGWYWNAAAQQWYSQGPAGIAIPIYTIYQQCAGFQIRTTHGGAKYQWLSSHRDPQGAPAQASPHFIPGDGRDLWITEGPIKAWITHQIVQSPCIGIPGISIWRATLPWIQQLHPQHIYLAFDQDAEPHVAAAVQHTTHQLARILHEHGYPVALVHWDGPEKGVDDALLAKAHLSIHPFVES